jgi:hypothetical protein
MPAVQLSMGNHDCWHSSQEKFEEDFGTALATAQGYDSDAWQELDLGQKQNSLTYVAGVPLIKLAPNCPDNDGADDNIYLSDYTYLYDFLAEALSQAAAARPDMPIIVMAHHGFAEMPSSRDYWGYFRDSEYASDTAASENDSAAGNRDLIALLSNYPQVLFFSGHVHNDLHTSDYHYAGAGFNAFACGTLGAYIEDLDDDSIREDSQGLLVDILEDGSSVIHRLDFSTEEEILPALQLL